MTLHGELYVNFWRLSCFSGFSFPEIPIDKAQIQAGGCSLLCLNSNELVRQGFRRNLPSKVVEMGR